MIDGFKLHHRDRDTSMAEHDYAVATLATEIVNEWSANTDSVQPGATTSPAMALVCGG
eukprot:COSAG02_NODE_4184_length_5655_cov_2.189885_2_plen_58_part_00